MTYHGNLPDNFSQAAFDSYWGKSTSDAVEDELRFQLEIQDDRAKLLNKLEKHKAALGEGINEDLENALKDAARTQQWLLEALMEQEAQAAADRKVDAAEYRAEMRREAMMWGEV
jgi:hypothetical protein